MQASILSSLVIITLSKFSLRQRCIVALLARRPALMRRQNLWSTHTRGRLPTGTWVRSGLSFRSFSFARQTICSCNTCMHACTRLTCSPGRPAGTQEFGVAMSHDLRNDRNCGRRCYVRGRVPGPEYVGRRDEPSWWRNQCPTVLRTCT